MEPNSKTTFRTAFHDINTVVPVDSSALTEVTMRIDKGGIARAIHEPRSRLRSPLGAVNCAAIPDTRFEGIVGSSEVLLHVLRQVARVAPTDCTVLVTGESGTGKELIARAIHKRSRRGHRPFIPVNCPAVPPALIASELFGHERGAFTGATERRLGRFELANCGTIFLDEIGDIPADTQVALLRAVQERELERVGAGHTVPIDVRVVASTNRDLEAAVKAGTFRMDLFYRLNVFLIRAPSLRERKDDIPLLAKYFIERYATSGGKTIKHVDWKTLQLLQAYDWPGNIRELQNMIERAVILCDQETLSIDDDIFAVPQTPALADALINTEKEIIVAALEESRGRVSGRAGAAVKLGIPRSTLESKIGRLKIDKHLFRPEGRVRGSNCEGFLGKLAGRF
jgi:transcriptional regulator with GAF, ATPase, and Fis domain